MEKKTKNNVKTTAINYEYLKQICRNQGISMSELSELLGKHKGFLSQRKFYNSGLSNDDIAAIKELMSDNLAMEELVLSDPADDENNDANAANTYDNTTDKTLFTENFSKMVIEELGIIKHALKDLTARIEALEQQPNSPQEIPVLMKPEDMAFTVLNGLLEDGWCTKDDVIRAFNKHKISMIHLNQAIERTGATLTTRGFADHVQTYYLKGKGEQGTEANHKYCNQ